MRKKAKFIPVAEYREKYFASLKQLHGGSDVKKEKNRQDADTRLEDADNHSKRVSGV